MQVVLLNSPIITFIWNLWNMPGAHPPDLTAEQLEMTRSRVCGMLGRALGIVVGCLLGKYSWGVTESFRNTRKTAIHCLTLLWILRKFSRSFVDSSSNFQLLGKVAIIYFIHCRNVSSSFHRHIKRHINRRTVRRQQQFLKV